MLIDYRVEIKLLGLSVVVIEGSSRCYQYWILDYRGRKGIVCKHLTYLSYPLYMKSRNIFWIIGALPKCWCGGRISPNTLSVAKLMIFAGEEKKFFSHPVTFL